MDFFPSALVFTGLMLRVCMHVCVLSTHFQMRELSIRKFLQRKMVWLLLLFSVPNPSIDPQLVAYNSEPSSKYLSWIHVVWLCSPEVKSSVLSFKFPNVLKQWTKRKLQLQMNCTVPSLFLFCTSIKCFSWEKFSFSLWSLIVCETSLPLLTILS